MPQAIFESAIRRFTGRFENTAIDIVKPAMVTATQPAVLQVAELEGRPAVHTAQAE
jgi:hypothetical protein